VTRSARRSRRCGRVDRAGQHRHRPHGPGGRRRVAGPARRLRRLGLPTG